MGEKEQQELALYTNERFWQGMTILVLNAIATGLLYGGYRLGLWAAPYLHAWLS